MISRDHCLTLDARDPLRLVRDQFVVPEGMIYLDGNSLGLMPKSAPARVARTVEIEWGQDLITSWNKHGWFNLAGVTGNKIARLIGAARDSVIVADTISVDVFKVLSAALALRRGRKIILSDTGNFPSDLYVAQGLTAFMADGHELRIVAPEELASSITEDVAVVMATEADYRTSRRHDMAAITAQAHAKGALTIWDLAHSAGAFAVDIGAAKADFAVGCTYKYLNGGPGAPAFVYVNPQLQNVALPALVGWWGHAAPFAFSTAFTPADGIIRQQCGTQSILGLAALDEALDIWADVDMTVFDAKAKSLCSTFIAAVEQDGGGHGLKLAGPRNMAERGAHVSFHHAEGYAVMQAMIARKVIGDFRAPDIVRFGFSALYNTHVEVFDAAQMLLEVLATRAWDKPEFRARKAVT
jgi:kynureninase